MIRHAIVAAIVLALAAPADAAGRHRPPHELALTERLGAVAGAVQGFVGSVVRAVTHPSAGPGAANGRPQDRPRTASWMTPSPSEGEEAVPNPPGCPSRHPGAYCGCGVAWKVYGHEVTKPNLNQASTWAGFPRSSCAPGRVGVWSGHVAYILECRGEEAKFWDPNSGGGLTRIHWRGLPRVVVDPPSGL